MDRKKKKTAWHTCSS